MDRILKTFKIKDKRQMLKKMRKRRLAGLYKELIRKIAAL